MAGKGSEIGRSFEELAAIYDGVVHSEKLRICFDTCHTNDAGYDLVQDLDGVLEQFDRVIGKDQIAVFHINDSKNPCNASKDRHENLGKGTIGFETLYRIVHHPDFTDVPKILETPWIRDPDDSKKSYAPYREEIARLRGKYII
jgi:deoxyribonuclease-4